MKFIKHILKKIILNRLFKKYVLNDVIIKEDIEQTIKVRGCNVRPDSLQKQYEHLMIYYPEFVVVFFWRINQKPKYWTKLFFKDYHCKLFGSSQIKGGLNCYHPFATVINAKSIGQNFQFRNSLTIGNKCDDNSMLPVIGDNVTVGANVVIIGGINIGNHVTIGAGSVVVKDVPSHCVIAGNPAMVIKTL
ncbi:hypothetical protein [uncultured Gelidibacter sp.]|uniref:hypothetical protein n=1 Tax=uncultured Gelidibacter sp. TaxID=259318 RepID=UPI00261ED2E5|nr:hypothetical protein [uncultured Gelidibacter sp.]